MCRHHPKSRLTHLSFNVLRGYRLNAIQKQKHGLSSLYYDKKPHYQVSLSAFSSVNNSSDCKAKAYFSQTHTLIQGKQDLSRCTHFVQNKHHPFYRLIQRIRTSWPGFSRDEDKSGFVM